MCGTGPPDPAPQILVVFSYHLLGGMHARRNYCTLWGTTKTPHTTELQDISQIGRRGFGKQLGDRTYSRRHCILPRASDID